MAPPAAEPVTTAEVKTYLRIDGDDFGQLEGLIKSAREAAEKFQERAFIHQTWDLVLDKFPTMPLKIPRPPLVSVESVKYIDYKGVERTWDSENYVVDVDSEPGRIALAYNVDWPSVELRSIGGVRIRFTAGYGVDGTVVPDSVKDAIVLYVGHRLDHPENEDIPDAFYNLLWSDRVVPV